MDYSKESTYPKGELPTLKILASLVIGSVLTAGGILIYQQHESIISLSDRVNVLESRMNKVQTSTEKLENRVDSTIRTTNRNFRAVKKTEDDFEEALAAIIEVIRKSSDPSSYRRNGS